MPKTEKRLHIIRDWNVYDFTQQVNEFFSEHCNSMAYFTVNLENGDSFYNAFIEYFVEKEEVQE